jgi:hypothetical protein
MASPASIPLPSPTTDQTQTLDTQVFPLAHLWPHAPQLLLSLVIFTSHPSAGLLLQSAKPWLHAAMWQEPFTHTVVAFGSTQGALHAPQLPTLL